MDGPGRPEASLPQMGTTAILQPDGTKRAEAWVQWFARDEVGLKLLVLPLPVTPGQTVACIVTVIGASGRLASIAFWIRCPNKFSSRAGSPLTK